MAKDETAKSGGAMGTIIAMLLLSLIGGAGGGFLGYTLAVPPAANSTAGADKPAGASAKEEASGDADAAASQDSHDADSGKKSADAHGGGHGGGHGDGHGGGHGDKDHGGGHGASTPAKAEDGPLAVKELPVIVTNLGKPDTGWIRLQAAIVYDPKDMEHADKLIAELMSDITAFLRNMTISALEGSDGLRRLQEDLTERAATRSNRKVREVIIETMVVQ